MTELWNDSDQSSKGRIIGKRYGRITMKRRDGFLERRIGGMHLIIPVVEGELFPDKIVSVNSTGMFLWDKLKNEQTEDSLAALLADEYEIDRETAYSDMKAFLDRAMEAELLEV